MLNVNNGPGIFNSVPGNQVNVQVSINVQVNINAAHPQQANPIEVRYKLVEEITPAETVIA